MYLIIDILATAKLTFSPEHPFIGDDIKFTCNSVVHSCPGKRPSNLAFKILGNKRGDTDKNTLTIHALAKSDKGMNISCQATDDLGIVFYLSETVTLDPYYGPDKVVLDPGSTSINVTENSTLGPIHCTAACNPPCTYQWKHNRTGRFEQVKNSLLSFHNQTLTVPHIERSQNGTYRCHVDDYQYYTYKISDIAINVQYGPDRVILEPASSYINVKEGDTLGPIHCTATCNPQCTYQWEYNVTGRFKLVPFELVSTQGRTLTVPQIQRSQAGIYRCHVDNYFTQIKMTAEVSITVQLIECPTKGLQAVTSGMFDVGIATLVVGLGAILSSIIFCIVKHKTDPPTDVRVDVVGNTTKFSWIIPHNRGITWSRLYLNNLKEGSVDLDLQRERTDIDIQFPKSSFEIANLKMCSKYSFGIRFLLRRRQLELTTKTFWITNTHRLTFRPEHPFVGNDITFTCNSVVHSCPGDTPSKVSLKFLGNQRGDTDKNTLTIHALAKSDTGTQISCQATDDLGKVFYWSDTVTLDPYYSPEKVVLDPGSTSINVTENSTLGPIHCTAACNPICTYQWKYNGTGHFEQVESSLLSNQNQTLTVTHIKRSQHGAYRCHVDYYQNHTYKMSDVAINVQYGPDRIILEPASTHIHVVEGTTLGPIHCTATCNPECKYQWEYNVAGRFELVPIELVSNQSRTLTVPQIKRSQTGTVRCHVANYFSQINKTVDVTINVQCVKTKNVRPNESAGYNEVQRSNPVFTDSYSTLQSNLESRPIQDPSWDIYEECGIAPDVSTYENFENRS
ncbi:cell adhesion molecule CEACAM5-like [Mytilus galloprovincialis]|uniref:cell adhesion molecule CEACAM5-like n=1 Tax=Mytilus galloprovincialis TaxID=29158 RepID=UPI003F7B606F